jgi:hypothetical protein
MDEGAQMKWLWRTNLTLLSLFGISSGLYKVFMGQADIDIFSRMGMTPTVVAMFGAVQLLAAVGLWIKQVRLPSAITLAACNGIATAGLFVAGVGAFAPISVVFILMALLVLKTPASGK